MLIVVERRASWQVPRAELLPLEQTSPVSVVQDTGLRSYAEADLYAYAVSFRRRETTPPTISRFPLGTWCIDTMDGLWQLRQYQLRNLWFLPQNNPYASQDDRGYFSDVWPWVMQKYVRWLEEGNEPPPLRGIETRNGSIRVTDGNNRAASLVQVDRHETLIWVSLATVTASGWCTSLTHQQAIVNALNAGFPVPDAVLAAYPACTALPCTCEIVPGRNETAFPETAGPSARGKDG